MFLTHEQANVIISDIHQHVTNQWAYISYEGCPRDTTPQNLEFMDARLRSFIAKIENHAELQRFFPSIPGIQDTLQKTVRQMSLARATFSWSPISEQRKGFYKAYRDIFKDLSRTRTMLAGSSVDHLPSTSPPVFGVQAGKSVFSFADRITEVRRIFHYKESPLGITQPHLLVFEKEFRGILECLITSPDTKKYLRSTDEAQEMLRETVLLLNFAADMCDLSSPEERSKQSLKAHTKVLESLTQLENSFRLRK